MENKLKTKKFLRRITKNNVNRVLAVLNTSKQYYGITLKTNSPMTDKLISIIKYVQGRWIDYVILLNRNGVWQHINPHKEFLPVTNIPRTPHRIYVITTSIDTIINKRFSDIL